MNINRPSSIIPTLALVGMTLAWLCLDYYMDGPSIITGAAIAVTPVLVGLILAGIVPKWPVKFGLSLAAIGFVFAFVSVPMTLVFIGSLGTAGLWLVIFVPIAIASLSAIAYGLLMALLGATSRASNQPHSPPSGAVD